MQDNFVSDMMELERQIKGTQYKLKQHEQELTRLREQLKRAQLAVEKDKHDLAPDERDMKLMEQKLHQLEAALARKHATLEKDERDLRSIDARERKEARTTEELKRVADNLENQRKAKERARARLNNFKQGYQQSQ